MNNKPKRSNNLPAPNVSELIEERNWAALAGLALMALGVLYALQHLLGLRLDLWALLLMGIGGWLFYDAWQQSGGSPWERQPTRTRALVGAALLLAGVMSILTMNWWGMFVLGAGAWLGYDTWQKVQALGGVWTRDLRNRMFVAGLLVFFGLSAFVSLSGWGWLVLIVGGVILYRRARA